MEKAYLYLISFLVLLLGCSTENEELILNQLRAPAYPLITIDPYTSAWSFSDNLYDDDVRHWTGKRFSLLGVLKVDDELYRFMGEEERTLKILIPSSEYGDWYGRYTFQEPEEMWMSREFDDSDWAVGAGAFGTKDMEPSVKTNWDTECIWVRRTIELEQDLEGELVYLEFSHDDDVVFYINGVEVLNTGNSCSKNVQYKLPSDITSILKKGENVIAAFCRNRVANGLLDFGLKIGSSEDFRFFEKSAQQVKVDVQATQTYYSFVCGGVDLDITFTAPLLLDDLSLLSRPINYITYNVKSNDGKNHEVELYLEASPNWARNQENQSTSSEFIVDGDLLFLKTGTHEQDILGKSGDDLRIDWGYFYLASHLDDSFCQIGEPNRMRSLFKKGAKKQIVSNSGSHNHLAFIKEFSTKQNTKGVFLLGYNDLYSIKYFNESLRPYWNRLGAENFIEQLHLADKEYESIKEKCNEFDTQLMREAMTCGGYEYANLCALAYRQAVSAHKLVESPQGDLLFLSKENFSNGCIGTLDVSFPSAPLFLYYNPELVKGILNPIFELSGSSEWNKPFPPHDLGVYPWVSGQHYEDDMPIEEAGNMLILTAAITSAENDATYAKLHWSLLTQWVNFLEEHGLNPELQYSTDEFTSPIALNANLSIKAIMGIAGYAYMAEKIGDENLSSLYWEKAKNMAEQWIKLADDGDYYRLAYNRPESWSQKYNLVWDKIMGWNVFPSTVAEKEVAFYLTQFNEYGLPLDHRYDYTKVDWTVWSATLADEKKDFEKFITPLYRFMNETVDRVPMSDWIYTNSPTHKGFRARSVVGGIFIKMLEEKFKYNIN